MADPYRTAANPNKLEATLPRAKFSAEDVPVLPDKPVCPKCGSAETKYEYRAAFESPSPEIWLSLIQNEYRVFGSFHALSG